MGALLHPDGSLSSKLVSPPTRYSWVRTGMHTELYGIFSGDR